MADSDLRSARLPKVGRDGSHRRAVLLPALRTSLLFLVLATVWILGSDYLLLKLAASESWASFQTVKGWLFVTVTSGFLLWIIYRDLNALYREQRQSKRAAQGMRHLFENSPIGIAVLDREGRITQWNRTGSKDAGMERGRDAGKPISSFCTEPGCEAGKAFARPQAEICEVDGQCRLHGQ